MGSLVCEWNILFLYGTSQVALLASSQHLLSSIDKMLKEMLMDVRMPFQMNLLHLQCLRSPTLQQLNISTISTCLHLNISAFQKFQQFTVEHVDNAELLTLARNILMEG